MKLDNRLSVQPEIKSPVRFKRDMTYREVRGLPKPYYQEWMKQNEERRHFFATPFYGNIMKVHRPGKLTYTGVKNDRVPKEEIIKWLEQAKNNNVLFAFVLLDESDFEKYYGGQHDENGSSIDTKTSKNHTDYTGKTFCF